MQFITLCIYCKIYFAFRFLRIKLNQIDILFKLKKIKKAHISFIVAQAFLLSVKLFICFC